jgi:predicted AlkP superfamily pyrophosphatase or phosphodiesterase
MFPGRHHVAGLLGLLGLAALTFAALGFTADHPVQVSPPPAFTPSEDGPRLAVLVVFDQMRGDYLSRWETLFGEGGFRRICTDGAWFQNCHYPYAATQTGPGHASVATGCSPDRHGIIMNDWFERDRANGGQSVYCASRKEFTGTTITPARLLAPTLADSLKRVTNGQGKVVSLSLKDRSAVLPGGRQPDVAFWQSSGGKFVTSSVYRRRAIPSWVTDFNQEKFTDRWKGQSWERLRSDIDYERYSGPDDHKGEDTRIFGGRTFPHPMGPTQDNPRGYYNAVTCSPFGNDLLLELTKRAVIGEKLGQRHSLDLLCVSFSSNDLVGHAFGPDSQEVLDITLRSDLIVRDLLQLLDDKVGKGRYVLALTADHGICPLPEVAKEKGLDAGRVSVKKLKEAIDTFLDGKFPGSGHSLILAAAGSNLYLNYAEIARRGAKPEEVATALADWLLSQPGVARAFTAQSLRSPSPPVDAIESRVRKSYYADRSGDVILVEKPYYLFGDFPKGTLPTGTNHGTPNDYDTHVPLVIYGAGVVPGKRSEAVTPQAAAAILAKGLGIAPPAKAEATVPDGLFK